MKEYLTIDIGRNWLRWSITSEKLDVADNGKKEIINITDKSAVFNPIRELADEFRNRISGIAISMPGVIDSETGTAYSGGVYEWVRNEPLGSEVEELTGLPVIIVNDAKAGALAEIGYGALKKVRHGVLLMILGTGIGGAFTSDGQIFSGSHFAAGEFSYMSGDYKNREEGNDMFALSMSIDGLTKLVAESSGNPKMNVMKIMFGLNAHDPAIERGVRVYCSRLARYIYNIQCVVDADRFVIGGNITDEPLFMKMIQEAVSERFRDDIYGNIFQPEVVPNAFHEDSRKYGSVYLFRKLKEGIE